jgi:pyruvate oxidase
MNITHVLVNNNELGKISKEQKAGNWDVWQTSLHNPDFAKYAKLCGAFGISVDHEGPSLVEIHSDAELI